MEILSLRNYFKNAVQTPGNPLLSFLLGRSNFGSFVSIASFQKRIFHQRSLPESALYSNPKKFKNQKMVASGYPNAFAFLLDYCFCPTFFQGQRQQQRIKRNVCHFRQFIQHAGQRPKRGITEKSR